MWWRERLAQIGSSAFHEQAQRMLIDRAYNKEAVYYSGAGSYDFLALNPSFRTSEGLSSAYIDGNGRVYILRPHTHDQTARIILSSVLERNGERLTTEEFRAIDSRMMPLCSGAIRAQLYLDGVGMTVDMFNPPTTQQIKNLKEYYDRTRGDKFIAEITNGRDIVAWTTTYDELIGRLMSLRKMDDSR